MKNVLPSCIVVIAALLLSQSASAKPLSNFWTDAHALINKCAVTPYVFRGEKKTYGPLRSKCKELVLKDGAAIFTLGEEYQNETFFAFVEDSAESDGGDLVDVTVKDSSGNIIAQLKNVLAFNDVLLALAGGQVQLDEVYDPSLLSEQ